MRLSSTISRTSLSFISSVLRKVLDHLVFAIGRHAGNVERDRQRRAVARQRAALAVEDEAARRLLVDEADGRPLGERLRFAAGQHLQVPEPPDERRQQREDEQMLIDGQPDGQRCSGSTSAPTPAWARASDGRHG